MYGLLLDHFQRFVVILYCNMSSLNIYVQFFKTKTEAFSLYIGISGLNISKHLTSKGYGLIVLDETKTKPIFTGISLQDRGLGAIIISQSGPEKHVTNLGLLSSEKLHQWRDSSPNWLLALSGR